MLRPYRPLKTRLIRVSSGAILPIASAQAGFIPASGHRRNPVPICTALAPSIRAAATPRPSAIPPVATTGTWTASTIAGRRENRPTRFCSALRASNAARWPPASIPCAMITSAPRASASSASPTVETTANQGSFFSLSRTIISAGSRPMTDETAAGLASSRASNWSAKSGGTASPALSGTSGPQAPKNLRSSPSARESRRGAGSGTHKFS